MAMVMAMAMAATKDHSCNNQLGKEQQWLLRRGSDGGNKDNCNNQLAKQPIDFF